MSKVYRRYRRDENERVIVRTLEQMGADVVRLDEFDLLVHFQHKLFALEVKNPGGKNRITPKQEEMIRKGFPLKIVRGPDEALQAIGVTTKR